MTAFHLLLFLPLVFLVLGWAVGRVVVGALRARHASEPMALLVGLAAMLAVLSNLSFLGLLGARAGTPVVLGLAAVGLVLGRRHLRAPDWREAAAFAVVPVVVYLHFLWPLLTHPGTEIALLYAGDFNQYVAMGSWLQDVPITVPADLDMDYNTLQSNVLDHQRNFLRIGALLFLGFFASVGLADVPSVYTIYTGFILGLQAVAVGLMARRLAPSLPVWTAALVGALYGLSPTASWAAYAAFVPQTLGLAFLVAGVASLVELLDPALPPAGSARAAVLRALPTGLLFFAGWSAYPEAMPLAVLIVLFFVVLSFGRRLAQLHVLRELALTAAGVLAGWILASPLNFWWGLRGILVQLQTMAHGGEQIVSLWTLFGTTVGAMQQPLIARAGSYDGNWFEIVSLACCVLAAIGMLWLVAVRQRALPLAIALSGAVLFGYISWRYSFAQNGSYPLWKIMLSWNLYKAAAFMAPYAMAMAVAGVLALAWRVGRNGALVAAAVVTGGMLVSLALHQYDWSHKEMTLVGVPPQARALFARMPPGRLLVDIHAGDTPQARYARYTVYSLLHKRPFLSTRDGQPTQIYALFDDKMAQTRVRLLSEPFSYVLTDRPQDYSRFAQLARGGSYALLDARQLDFQVSLRDYGAPPITLVNFARSPHVREVTTEIIDVPPESRVLYNAFGVTQAMEKQPTRNTAVLLKAPPAGGLAQFVYDPVAEEPPAIMIRDGFVPTEIPTRIDLLPQIVPAEVAGDASGALLTLHKEAGGVRLDMPRAGTSRVRVAADLYPGEYELQMEIGDVKVVDRDPAGFGAFLGEENVKAATVELAPLAHKRHAIRIFVRQPRKVFVLVGFGAWGKAAGSIELKSLVLVRRTGQP